MECVAVSFTNLGPYHVARLRALARRLSPGGCRLVAYETAGTQGLYPWVRPREAEPFERVTLFPDAVLEDLPASACSEAMARALDRDRPDAVMFAGYVRPECLAMIRWARRARRPRVLMCESQAVDHPRAWWKEAVKRRRVARCSAGFVGGPSHRAYLVSLGMPAERITLGYNAIDGEAFAARAAAARRDPASRAGLPEAPYFLAVSRFAPEKNLVRLVQAYARYRASSVPGTAWDLALCGSGPAAPAVERALADEGCAGSVHRPGFLQAEELAPWLAHAAAFVHPALSEPWGLVVNEAAACGLPLIVSERAGCVGTFVPENGPTTGLRIDPLDVEAMAVALHRVATLDDDERAGLGRHAAAIASQWGPDRFASGAAEALQIGMVAECLQGAKASA